MTKSIALNQILGYISDKKFTTPNEIRETNVPNNELLKSTDKTTNINYNDLYKEVLALKIDLEKQKKTTSMAGWRLRQSSNCLWGYVGASIIGTGLIVVGYFKNNSRNKVGQILFYSGISIEVVGLVSWLIHIGKLDQAGQQVQ
ncbi:MAG: hypothetical protein WCQ95_01395 [Bacteroidota bacterium]